MMTLFLASLAGIPPLRGLVRQVRDVPVDHRRRAPAGAIALGDHRRGQLGDRVLLLLRASIRGDVVPRAGRRTTARRSVVPPAARRRDRADGRGRRRDRHLPAALRAGRGARVLSAVRATDAIARARSSAKARSRSTGSWRPRSTSRGRLLRGGSRRRPRRPRLRHEPRGRPAVRRVRRARARPAAGASSTSPIPFLVVEAGAGNGRLARDVLRAAPGVPARAALRARRALGRAARRAARAARRSSRPTRRSARSRGASPDDAPIPVAGAGPVFAALDELPALELAGVVLANELLDNLPFGIAECERRRAGRRCASRSTATGGFAEVLVPGRAGRRRRARRGHRRHRGAAPAPGSRSRAASTSGSRACGRVLRRGTLVVIDYVDDARGHPRARRRRLAAHVPGARARRRAARRRRATQDITADVVLEQLLHAARRAGFTLVADRAAGGVARATSASTTLVDDGPPHVGGARARRRPRGARRPEPRRRGGARSPIPAGLGAHRVVTFAVERPLA